MNDKAEPGIYLHNVADLYSDDSLIARDVNDVLVCCQTTGDPNIIYVDVNAEGGDTGIDWENAYSGPDGVAKALARIRNTECVPGPNTIYVAQGTYDPNNTPDNTLELVDGISVYGGFKSGDTFSQRDPKKYETILTGVIDDDAFPDVDSVVTMADETLIDGITVMYGGAFGHCIYGSGVDFTIENCTIKDGFQHGLYAESGNVVVKQCTVNNNNATGIYHEGEGFTLTVENSWILRNGEYGIYCQKSTPVAKNSIISESGLVENSRAGVRLYRPTYSPLLQNCTISNNRAEGVSFVDNGDVYGDPNNLDYPAIRSCILYYNNLNGPQLAGLNPDAVASYSCIADCNELNTTNYNDVPGFAYAIDPNGTPDPNNYHLLSTAFCVNRGDPSFNDNTLPDYDGETRVMGTYVDIGADEVDPGCGDVANELDLGADGLVNLVEFSRFSAAWLTYDPNHPLCDPNHPNYVSDPNDPDYITQSQKDNFDPWCDLVADLHIDLADLESFVSDTPWLWIACWKSEQMVEAMAATSGGGESMVMAAPMMSTMSFESASLAPVEEENIYVNMSNTELASLVMGIYEVMESIADSIDSGHENAENLVEAKEFLQDVLSDIEASRQ